MNAEPDAMPFIEIAGQARNDQPPAHCHAEHFDKLSGRLMQHL